MLEAFILFSFYQAAILAKESRQAWSNIVATLRIVANVQGNAKGIYGRLVGQYVISRSYRLKSFWFSFPPHKRIKDKTNKLLSVGAPGEVNAVALQLTFGVPLCTHPGIVFKLTAIPTDTRSNRYCSSL